MKRRLSIALLAVLVPAVAACSSTSSGGSGDAGSGAGSSNAAGVAAAKAFLAPYLASPTSIGVTTPLTAKPAADKFIVGLVVPTGEGETLGNYWAQAAAALGWKFKGINSGLTTASMQAAMNSALQLNPNGIVGAGITSATISAQLKIAQQRGIWFNSISSVEKAQGAFYDTSIDNTEDQGLYGKLMAAEAVASTNGAAHVEYITIPTFGPIEAAGDDAFISWLKKWCNACTVQLVPQQATDLGTVTPSAVVSAVQAHPDTNWVMIDIGSFSQGVSAALKAAGLSKVKIGGIAAGAPNITAMKDKTEYAWTAFPLPIVAYRQIDSLARKFEGDPVLNVRVPTEVIAQSNVNQIVTDSSGDYQGVTNFQSFFLKLWHISG